MKVNNQIVYVMCIHKFFLITGPEKDNFNHLKLVQLPLTIQRNVTLTKFIDFLIKFEN